MADAERTWVVPVSAGIAEEVRRRNIPPEKRLVVATDYPLRPLPEGLVNPHVLLPVLSDQKFDVTAFYSRSKPLSDEALAERAEFDKRASDAAETIGGLRMYYRGSQIPEPDDLPVSPDLGINYKPDAVSFCIWDSREKAKEGAKLSAHLEAVGKTNEWYENITIIKYTIWTVPGIVHNGREFEEIIFQQIEL